MLPAAAMYYFPWEIKCGALHDGQSVRTFGRLTYYDPEKSQASLTVQHASEDHQVVINTSFVEPFNPIIGAQYVVLGDIQTGEGNKRVSKGLTSGCVRVCLTAWMV
ncbi:CST complex subunit TEN1 isoform X2 [Syngnathoides biaculeatus]|uniref:CST complex subunit TEN1 isoform X2 n=1 Tax=Syngnathoides biaculeatus TaxID=300417 RepID=UPI002ADDD795|nr:CST complex subunit TEN1 isoform X2 [Syngnathoides biaculeatus]